MVPAPLPRNRDFRLLWAGQALSEAGSQVSTVAYPLLVLALTHSAAKAGVVGFAKALPFVVFALPAGVVADRVDRRRLMLACDAGRALALGSIAVALLADGAEYAQIAAVAFVDGALFATSYVAERGALSRIVAREDLPAAVARNEARTFAASIVGPPLGGVLFAAGRFVPFLADAASYLGSAVALTLVRDRLQEERVVADAPGGRVAELVEGLRWLWRRPFFRAAALLFAAGNPLLTGLSLLAVLLATRHGASPAAVGAMLAIVGAGGLAGAMAAGRLRRSLSARAALLAESWLIAALVPLLLAVGPAIAIGLVVAGAELLTPVTNSLVTGRRVALTPDRLQGRVQAASMMLAQSLGWLGPLAVGFAFQHAGPTATVLGVAAWALALALTATAAPGLRRG